MARLVPALAAVALLALVAIGGASSNLLPASVRHLLAVARGRVGGRERRPQSGRGTARVRVQPALLRAANGVVRRREVTGREHASGRLRRARIARELLRARQRPARCHPDQPVLHPRSCRADPAAAAVSPGRRPGARRLGCRRGRRAARERRPCGVDPADRGQGVVGVRRTLGRVGLLLHPIPLGPIPTGAVPIGLAPASPANHQNWLAETVLAWPVAP
jgi:hypothetical protein